VASRTGCLVLTSLLACAKAPERLFVGLPPHSAEQSAILALEKDGQNPILYALSLSSSAPLDLEQLRPGFGAIRLVAVVVAPALDGLGFSQGPVASFRSSDPMTEPVSNLGAQSWTLEVDEHKAVADWSPSAPDPLFATFYVKAPPDRSCASFKAHSYTLTSTNDGRLLLPLTSSTALVGASGIDDLFVADRDGFRSTPTPTVPHEKGVLDDHGEIWTVSLHGIVWRGRYDPTAGRLVGAELTSSSSAAAPQAMTVVRTGTQADLYLATDGPPRVRFFDGRNWSVVYAIPPSPLAFGGALAALPNGEVVALINSRPSAVWMRGGKLTRTEVIPFLGDVRGGGYVPGVGVVALSLNGEIAFTTGDGHWTSLASPTQIGLFRVTPYEDGFLAGGSFGNLVQYHSGTGASCLRMMTTGFEIHFLATFGRDAIVYGDRPPGSTASVITYLERIAAP
jgi:hypothetical protein